MQAPISPEKSQKYDRQIRLWGERGQNELQKAKVGVINATATCTELLKNLILPGIGSFEIIDNKIVNGEDVGSNFFLDKESIGKLRGECATLLLKELNEDVNGFFHHQDLEDLIGNQPSYFKTFSIIIATDLNYKVHLNLSRLLEQLGVGYIFIRSCGLLGLIRLNVKNHTVIESQPDNKIEDLRLSNPFKELEDYCATYDLNKLSKTDHSHTPWLIIIHKYLSKWREEHNGENPKSYKEKTELKNNIRHAALHNEQGTEILEENIEEAIKNTNLALTPIKIPESFNDIKSSKEFNNLTSESKPFWLMSYALDQFITHEGNGCLPLRGVIPDMTSDTKRYVELQNVYRMKAAKDSNLVYQHLQNIQSRILSQNHQLDVVHGNISPNPIPPKVIITEKHVKLFCSNASYIRLIDTHSPTEEYKQIQIPLPDIDNYLKDNLESSEFVYYVLIRAGELYFADKSQHPGQEENINDFKQYVTNMLSNWGISGCSLDEYIEEFSRYGGCELHSTAAYLGGVGAQEAIKLITHQYVPINNTFIYNGIKQTSSIFKL